MPCWKELSEATSGYGSGPVLGQGARPSGVTSRPAWQSTGWPPGALAEPVVGPLVTPGRRGSRCRLAEAKTHALELPAGAGALR